MEKVLEVKNLRKSYGSFEAVAGIDFEVSKGEIFGLIGPNGAGKSTTLKMISTLLSPSGGEIKVAGFDRKTEPDRIRKMISYLPEDSGSYKNLKGIDYLRFMAGLYADNDKEASEFVKRGKELSGLGGRLNEKTSSYSKGMTRKLLLARTVMMNPVLAILDEPTSGLDVVNAMEVRKMIQELARKGMTVLLSSHNMLEVEFLSDRVAIIDNGQIHDTGKPDELKRKYNARNLEEVFEAVVNAGKRGK